MAEEMVVKYPYEYVLGACPVCHKKRVRCHELKTECGHDIPTYGLTKQEWLKYIFGDANEQIHYGQKMKLKGFDELQYDFK